MSFNDNIHLDPSRVATSGAGRKIAGAGGGSILGVLLILGFSPYVHDTYVNRIEVNMPKDLADVSALFLLILLVGGCVIVSDRKGCKRARRVSNGRDRTVS